MHEMSIVQALIDQVEAEVEKCGQHDRVIRLELKVGRMSGVHVDSLRFAFEVLAPGTIAEGSELLIDEPRAVCSCNACGSRRELEDLLFYCPACGSDDILIQGGQDLLLHAIELED